MRGRATTRDSRRRDEHSDRPQMPRMRFRLSEGRGPCLRNVLRSSRGCVRLRGGEAHADPPTDRISAAEPVALPGALAAGRGAKRRPALGIHPAGARRSAGASPRRTRALGEGRFGQPPDVLLQGSCGLRFDLQSAGARLRHRLLRLDRKSRELRVRARGSRRPHLLRVHPARPREGKVIGSAIYGPRVVAIEGNYDDVNRLLQRDRRQVRLGVR